MFESLFKVEITATIMIKDNGLIHQKVAKFIEQKLKTTIWKYRFNGIDNVVSCVEGCPGYVAEYIIDKDNKRKRCLAITQGNYICEPLFGVNLSYQIPSSLMADFHDNKISVDLANSITAKKGSGNTMIYIIGAVLVVAAVWWFTQGQGTGEVINTITTTTSSVTTTFGVH